MWHLPPGLMGVIVGAAIFLLLGPGVYLTRERGPFNLDHQDKPGAFEPFLQKYLRASEFVVGLATGSIVLLVGSSALHGQTGHLPWFYASPLLMLGYSVIYGIVFMVWLIFHYEEYQHGVKHTRMAYAFSLTSGFSSLVCFIVGYFWLIFRVAV